ncbi:AAA family ATPase [Microlunatus speluncae]|uniref:AAA family ATPase n=1 Tax=Microlunatus speluncae TaxID=2594267 RepID=UPI0012663678|nr:AAA family ATPase [Microlunatus speluncae]
MGRIPIGEEGKDWALRVRGAAENSLRDVDVTFGRGLTAVVGVSGSGKSSLVMDTLYSEARRRFLESVSLGSLFSQVRPARVRSIDGLRPAVSVGQNAVNTNPRSTVATAVGILPLLRVVYAIFVPRRCACCGADVGTRVGAEVQDLDVILATLAAVDADLMIMVPLLRQVPGRHGRLLAQLRLRFDPAAVEVDGAPLADLDAEGLDPGRPHDIDVAVGRVGPATSHKIIRSVLDQAWALGTALLRLRDPSGAERTVARGPYCGRCGERIPELKPGDFPDHPQAANHRLEAHSLTELLDLSADALLELLAGHHLPEPARPVLDQITVRLTALRQMEVGYLPLSRSSPTLSRGEAQRVRLAVVAATRIDDLLHVLDEPTIGLDAVQVGRLLRRLGRLRGPVIMVEHDPWAIAEADDVIELGPGGGERGGRITFQGTPAELLASGAASGEWFFGHRPVTDRPATPTTRATEFLTVRGARAHNLTGFDVTLPTGRICVVTGPSGAGKSTLVGDVLVASVKAGKPIQCDELEGPRLRAVVIDQAPIGRTPRSNAATYTGAATQLRRRFAAATQLSASAFSFNRAEGACPTCAGMGAVELKLPHLPSEWQPCETCDGQRFGDDVLAARVTLADGRPYSIAELYDSTIEDAAGLLGDDPPCRTILDQLVRIGLGYLRLGQPSTTLSGGEAQRIKIAKWLATARSGDLVVLDEPTTGLHPADLSRLADVLRDLAARGCTVVVVEHHPDLIGLADWVIRLGPGGGPAGGRLISAGPDPAVRRPRRARPRTAARKGARGSPAITVSGAAANNLRDLSVTFAKNKITGIVGVSGSGKSSLLIDVLAAEAHRQLLECLSMYERQSVRELPSVEVGAVAGIGPTVFIRPDRDLNNPRSTIGSATEVSLQLGILLARAGSGARRPLQPNHFSGLTYESACLGCRGLGTLPVLRPERLIIHPEKPLCAGAMYSPGYFPQSYLSKPESGGFAMIRGLAERCGFDPFGTPWAELTEPQRQAFLYGEDGRQPWPNSDQSIWPGFFEIIKYWDQGGLYLDHVRCPDCGGGRLRPEFLAVRLGPANRQTLHELPLAEVLAVVDGFALPPDAPPWVHTAKAVAVRRLRFLGEVGLGYLQLDRPTATLSAGEAQRVKLAGLLGGELTGMTVLLDEPTRGLHPTEIRSLATVLTTLRDGGNTIILTDHDPDLLEVADELLVLGPGSGAAGGTVLPKRSRAARALQPGYPPVPDRTPRAPTDWLRVHGARENNLVGDRIDLPLGVLVGVCGPSGSGKSTLCIDTIGRALDPPRLTTSVAREEVNPGRHDAIENAPARTVCSSQARLGGQSVGHHLGLLPAVRRAFLQSDEVEDLGLTERDLTPNCRACRGRGYLTQELGFLPSIDSPCDACESTGYDRAVRRLRVRGHDLSELAALTLTELGELWPDVPAVARGVRAARSLGLGYLRLGQPGRSLSGGEAQRIKLTRALAKRLRTPTLFILDEPTVGLHPKDVEALRLALDAIVDDGHTVLVVEHDPWLLAGCDWLIELGPDGGPAGGRVVATGTPRQLIMADTVTAPQLRRVLS